MSMPHPEDDAQLSFHFQVEDKCPPVGAAPVRAAQVMSFVDAQTREVRRLAAERLTSMGIFEPPEPTR
ncbi:MAG: hypothetical protein HY055_13845 [Magnetospirillum sp.]|nr:hypothetical protein [Magnetospirillum sp.]